MNAQLLVLVLLGLATASYAAPAANGTTAGAAPSATQPAPAASKPEYPKDLGNGVEMINREDCPGGYCETFLVRPPPPGMQPPMGMGMGMPGMGMGMGMGMGGGATPCCPQLPPSPCGGQTQSPCQLGPPPSACNSPCPQGPPMMGR